ncbi:MAG: hypothetical protein R3B49_00840 [Phycisphaerales bacterium]
MAETYTVRLVDGRGFGPADLGVIKTWAAQGRVPIDAKLEPSGGGEAIIAGEHPELAGAINAPPTMAGVVGAYFCSKCGYDRSGSPSRPCPECGCTSAPVSTVTDGTGGLIPYKNPMALAAYYAGIGSLITMFVPFVGPICSVVVMVLGVKGIRAYKLLPARRGVVHAWVGIAAAIFSLVIGLLFSTGAVFAILR